MRRLLSVIVVAAAAAPGLGLHAAAAATTREPESMVVQATGAQVAVYANPTDAAPTQVLANPTPTDGLLVLLVDELGGDGWAKVILPGRPNGSTGWVRMHEVVLSFVPYRVVIDLSDHRLMVQKKGKTVLEAPTGVGKAATPTPGGTYYLTQLFAPPTADGPYGPFAYSLSGMSDVLTTFNGGEPVIGIHGTNRPDLVGTDVSSGCIRVTNDVIRKMVKILPLGTPVTIRS
jgi:lipoprotein-anchoring transpeptidase ErfK/SrfK